MRLPCGRALTGLLVALAAAGAAPLAGSPTAAATEPSAHWVLGPPASALPYREGLVRLSPTRVLLVGRPYYDDTLCNLSGPGVPSLPRLGVLEDPCRPAAALFDSERGAWRPAARPPLGLDPYPFGSGYAAAAGGNGYFIAAYGNELGSALLRYSGTGNTWTAGDSDPGAPVGACRPRGIGRRGRSTGGDRGRRVRSARNGARPDGRWRGLPAAPFRARNENLLGEGPGPPSPRTTASCW